MLFLDFIKGCKITNVNHWLHGCVSYGVKRAILAVLCLVAFLGVACSSDVERCAKCGMDVEKAPRWIAGLTLDDGTELRFCSPRCLFAWMHKEGAAGTVWVTEYYSQQRMPAAEMQFVVGSDVVGPMGSALVPLNGPEAAEQFRYDHDGERVVRMPEITVELLRSLKKRSQ